MRESWSFGRQAAQKISALADADVAYDVVWPVLAQAQVGLAARKYGIPQISHIMDVYPESAYRKVPEWVQCLVRRPLIALDRANAFRARKIVVISENMRETYEQSRGIPPARIEVVPIWQDEGMFRSLANRDIGEQKYGLKPRAFTFLYLGNIGPVAGVELLIRAFAEAALENSRLLIIGEGSQKRECVELASSLPARIHFISDPEVANVPLLHSLADVCLLPMKRGAAYSSFPSKLPGYMFSGKPILATLDAQSQAARCIREAQCGWVGEAEDVAWLAAKMREVAALPTELFCAMGQRGRTYGLKYFSKTEGVRRLADLVIATAIPRKHVNDRMQMSGKKSLWKSALCKFS